MDALRDRILVIGQDRYPEWRRVGESLSALLGSGGLEVRVISSEAVRVPDLNASDILVFMVHPEVSSLEAYGPAYDALSGMCLAGRLGAVYSSARTGFVALLENSLRDTGITLADAFVAGGAPDRMPSREELESWTGNLIAKRKEMIDARRAFAR